MRNEYNADVTDVVVVVAILIAVVCGLLGFLLGQYVTRNNTIAQCATMRKAELSGNVIITCNIIESPGIIVPKNN